MECVFFLKTIIIWLGIQLSCEKSVTNNCGSLSYNEPAVAKRNVSLKFEPVQVVSNTPVEWRHLQLASTGWLRVYEQWNFHLDNFSLVINTSTSDQRRFFYAQYGSCISKTITLKLEELSGCGLLYERTNNVRPGGTMELGYFPTWDIINNEATYVRIFEITNSTCPNGCRIYNLPGVYETRALGYNHEYVLAITLRETFVNGRYRLRCTKERPEGLVYTKYIEVAIPESPNIPELINTQSIEGCRKCIVGVLNAYVTIRCRVKGGTAPLHVNITVAGESIDAFFGTGGIFTANVRLTAIRHMAEVRCSVTNIALDSPLFTEANIYILDERTILFNVSTSIKLMESTSTLVKCKASWASTVWWLDSENRTALPVTDCGIGGACLRLENVSEKNGGNYTCLANDSWFNVSKQLTVTVEGLPGQHTLAKTDDQTSSTIIISSMACIVLLLAVSVLVVLLKRRNSKKSEMIQHRGAAAGADNREVDARNEEIHEYEEMHEYEGLADRGPSHAYEGLSEIGPSRAYEGLAESGPAHVNEGLAKRGPSNAYEGLAERGSYHVYEGLADRGPSHAHEGLADRVSSNVYEGLAERGSSHAYEGLADIGPSHAYEELADIDPSHAYEGLANRGPSHAYESMNAESKTVTKTHEEGVYMN